MRSNERSVRQQHAQHAAVIGVGFRYQDAGAVMAALR